MLSFKNSRHKRYLIRAFTHCFQAVQDELGNLPAAMQKSHVITGSIVGICRGFAINHRINESSFERIIDAVFKELFKKEALIVETRAERWLHYADEMFMFAYYHAKAKALNNQDMELTWLSDYAITHFSYQRQLSHMNY